MPTSEPIPPASYERDTSQSSRYRVLLVEDDRFDQIVFRKFVREAGLSYECTIVGSVSEAQDVLRWSPPFDVVVCDYLLGDGTAFDILDLVKEAPVILVTGAGGEETAVQAWKAGAYDYLVKDAHGDYLKALAITVENSVEHARARKEVQLLSGAIMSAEDCICITDLHGRILFVNQAFCRTYGYQRGEILGKDSSILGTSGHQSTASGGVLEIQTAGGGSTVGFYHERQDGRRFPVSLSRSIIKDANGQDVAVVGIARDISERLLLMDEFCSEIAGLEAHSDQYMELTVTVLGALDSLLRRKDTNRALCLIMDLREILEIGRKGIPGARADVNLELLITQVVETLRPAAAEKEVELAASVPETALTARADWDHVLRGLTSILRSLIYAVPGKTRLCVRAADADKGIRVEMESNDAIGAIPKICKAMDGLDSFGGHSDPHGDLVLALFAAKRLVELHGGTIGTDPRRGQGGVLLVTLPKSKEASRDSLLVGSGADQHSAGSA